MYWNYSLNAYEINSLTTEHTHTKKLNQNKTTKETSCGNTQMGAQGIERNQRLPKQFIYFLVNKIKKLWMGQINFALNKHTGKGNPLL